MHAGHVTEVLVQLLLARLHHLLDTHGRRGYIERVRNNPTGKDPKIMRTPKQAKTAQQTLRAQLLAAQLTEPMRHAMLTAQGTVNRDDLTGDTVADYCPGHESLRGDRMGASDYCEGANACQQAVDAYRAERAPDAEVLHVRKSDTVKIGTVCALLDRGLLERSHVYDEYGWPQHLLTDLGRDVHAHLVARRADGRL